MALKLPLKVKVGGPKPMVKPQVVKKAPAPKPIKMPSAKRGTSDGYLAAGNPTAADENIE